MLSSLHREEGQFSRLREASEITYLCLVPPFYIVSPAERGINISRSAPLLLRYSSYENLSFQYPGHKHICLVSFLNWQEHYIKI